MVEGENHSTYKTNYSMESAKYGFYAQIVLV